MCELLHTQRKVITRRNCADFALLLFLPEAGSSGRPGGGGIEGLPRLTYPRVANERGLARLNQVGIGGAGRHSSDSQQR
jgi:hypothetical protein